MSTENKQAIVTANEYAQHYLEIFIKSDRTCKASHEAARQWFAVAGKLARKAVKEATQNCKTCGGKPRGYWDGAALTVRCSGCGEGSS